MVDTNRTKMRLQWRMHKLIWKLSGGRLGRRVIGMPVLELITTGHKSGQERQILITYVDMDGAPAIIGTNGGRDVDPAWVKNLRANPEARARWDGTWRNVSSAELSGNDYETAWSAATDASPAYAEYKQVLTRPIPIVRLDPH